MHIKDGPEVWTGHFLTEQIIAAATDKATWWAAIIVKVIIFAYQKHSGILKASLTIFLLR